jgi:hypothetical protein
MIHTMVFCAVTLCNPVKLAPAEMLLTFIWEIPGLNPSQDTSYPEIVHGSPLSIQANAEPYFKLGDGHFLPHPFQFIHSYNATCY